MSGIKFARSLCRSVRGSAFCVAILFGATIAEGPAIAQTPNKEAKNPARELFLKVEATDAALFDAFNHCDLDKLTTFFVPELEFYHDLGGPTWSRDKFIADVKQNVCNKFRRELVPGTLEVWPIGDFGAVYSGTHRFCQFGAARCEGQGRFLHILQNKAGEWRVTRVVSYDHRPAP